MTPDRPAFAEMDTLAVRIALAARRLHQTPLTAARRARIERSAVDFAACLHAGARRPEAALAAILASPGNVTVPGMEARFDAPGAALVSGSVGALLQLHDAFPDGGNHPSSAVAATILAMRRRSSAGLEETLAAMACGYEAANRLAGAGYPRQQRAGLTPTSVAGALGAALAAGLMLGQNQQTLATAVALAAMTAPATPFQSLRQHAEAAPLHGGLAARAGVEAALLAEAGAEPGDLILEGDTDTPGWLQAMRIPSERLRPEAWDGSTLDAVVWKLFPACFASHLSIETVLAAKPIDPAAIIGVEIGLAPAAMTLVSRGPTTLGLYDRLMSVRWAVARALLYRGLELDAPGLGPDASLEALIARITTFPDPELARLPSGQVGGRIHVLLASGEMLDLRRRRGLRDPSEPGDPRGAATDPADAGLDRKLSRLAPGLERAALLNAFAPDPPIRRSISV